MANPNLTGPGVPGLSKFNESTALVKSASARLEKMIDRCYDAFSPVLGPDRPSPCNPSGKETPQSEFESFICQTTDFIEAMTTRLEMLRDRSVI